MANRAQQRRGQGCGCCGWLEAKRRLAIWFGEGGAEAGPLFMRDSGVGRTPQRGIRMETDTATGQSPGWRRNEVGDDRQVGPGGKPKRGEATHERATAERAAAN